MAVCFSCVQAETTGLNSPADVHDPAELNQSIVKVSFLYPPCCPLRMVKEYLIAESEREIGQHYTMSALVLAIFSYSF